MIRSLPIRTMITAIAASAALAASQIAAPQSQSEHQQGSGGMMGMMQGCPMMRGGGMGGMGHGMHLPPGNEKLEMQMHADMMRAMADVMSKYAARLPDKK